ncbi:Lateral signaling target protein 2-like protein [Diplonema papillatum]|nr:Lateral signaling target protein 2-like protein [Diplonema papillatum]
MSASDELLLGDAQRPVWVPDAETKSCTACDRTFGATVRRHHCRVCGLVFCKKCCGEKLHLPSLGYNTPQLICTRCRGSAPGVVGMKVQVLQDVAKVRVLCGDAPMLPPWDPRKAAFCGCVGTIEAQDARDGSVKVCFPNGPFIWYPPSALVMVLPTAKLASPNQVETRVVLVCRTKLHFEGAYNKLENTKHNGVSVYAMGSNRLYSNIKGNWVLTISPAGMEKEQGSIRSKEAHGGKKHPYSMNEWETFRSGQWVPIPEFKAFKSLVPGGSSPCINSTIIQAVSVKGTPTITSLQVTNSSTEASLRSRVPPMATLGSTSEREATTEDVDDDDDEDDCDELAGSAEPEVVAVASEEVVLPDLDLSPVRDVEYPDREDVLGVTTSSAQENMSFAESVDIISAAAPVSVNQLTLGGILVAE